MSDHIKIITILTDNLDERHIIDFIGLQNKVFNNNFNYERFSRKYLRNIYGPSIITMAYDNDLCVGTRSFLRNDIGSVMAYQPCDTCVMKTYRGKGLFIKMTQKALENIHENVLIYNFPNDSSLPGNIKLGWEIQYRKRYNFALFKKSYFDIDIIDQKTKQWILSDRVKESNLFYVKKRDKYYLLKLRKFNMYLILGEIDYVDTVNLKKANYAILLTYSLKGYFGRGVVAVTKNNCNKIDIPIYKMDTILD